MAERSSRIGVKKKKGEEKKPDKQPKTPVKSSEPQKMEEEVKKPDKQPKTPVKSSEPQKMEEEVKKSEESEGATSKSNEDNGAYQPIDLPPFEVVKGEQMTPFYFKFQFRNVEYSSGRNKTLLCYRVDSAGGRTERGYMEDEHATAHAEDAFFQQVLPNSDSDQDLEVTWYVSSSPCVTCATKLTKVLQQRRKLRLYIFCSRVFEWEDPVTSQALKILVQSGCQLRVMKPADFQLVWDTYVEKEDEAFSPWEDCQENSNYYEDKLTQILQ